MASTPTLRLIADWKWAKDVTKWAPPFTAELADDLLKHDITRARERHARRITQISDIAAKSERDQEARRIAIENGRIDGLLLSEQLERVHSMLKDGMSRRQIERDLKISRGRARRLCWDAERLIARENFWTDETMQTHMPTLLGEYLGKPWYEIAPATVRASDMSGFLKKLPHCSVKTLERIHEWAMVGDKKSEARDDKNPQT